VVLPFSDGCPMGVPINAGWEMQRPFSALPLVGPRSQSLASAALNANGATPAVFSMVAPAITETLHLCKSACGDRFTNNYVVRVAPGCHSSVHKTSPTT